MRSDLIFGALAHVKNRYTLCQLASKATRKLHKPNTRLQDTTNEVLVRFHHESPAAPAAVLRKHLRSSSAAQRKRGPVWAFSTPSLQRHLLKPVRFLPVNPSDSSRRR